MKEYVWSHSFYFRYEPTPAKCFYHVTSNWIELHIVPTKRPFLNVNKNLRPFFCLFSSIRCDHRFGDICANTISQNSQYLFAYRLENFPGNSLTCWYVLLRNSCGIHTHDICMYDCLLSNSFPFLKCSTLSARQSSSRINFNRRHQFCQSNIWKS